jgi:hypothetical protein
LATKGEGLRSLRSSIEESIDKDRPQEVDYYGAHQTCLR